MDGNVHRTGQERYPPLIQYETEKSKRLNLLLAAEILKLFETENLQLTYFSKLISLASSKVIVDVIEEQAADVQDHLRRLEKVCALLKLSVQGKMGTVNAVVRLMMKEGIEAVKKMKPFPSSSDRIIILEVQKVSHFNMVNYMNLSTWAKILQLEDISELLEDNLDDIINADLSLSELAESDITPGSPNM